MPSRIPNRLAGEKSPYLQQHAFNPVDWYPWGDDAFEKARREDKPLLISVGYSTCHWCHVMEHESFENEDTAKIMNEYLVCVKVDREERPDVDKLLMTAVSAMTGQGGWPLNAFLTPDLKPFYGGTYYPPVGQWGQPAWTDLIRHLGTAWRDPEERKTMIENANHLMSSLQKYLQTAPDPAKPDRHWVDAAYQSLRASYDEARGGFSEAPKFPMPVYLQFLLQFGQSRGYPDASEMSLQTLRAMARGGIYDQLGGGFSRYSTDPHWHIPHFEKMLYDNAQLVSVFVDAYSLTRDPDFERIARETLDYVLRDLTAEDGTFYSAEDADSLPKVGDTAKREGAFYVWSWAEITAQIPEPDIDVLVMAYGLQPGGNARHDPHGEFRGQNILYRAHPVPELARHFQKTQDEIEVILRRSRQTLWHFRERRPRPHRDEKRVTAWNGLMISAFSKAYQTFGNPTDLQAAQKAADGILRQAYDTTTGFLYRATNENQRRALGVADDYAFLVKALLDLYEADFDPRWLEKAVELHEILMMRFYDSKTRTLFMTASDQDSNLPFRLREDQDNVEPAASSVTAANLLRLPSADGGVKNRTIALGLIEALGDSLRRMPRAMPSLLGVLETLQRPPAELLIMGDRHAEDTQALLAAARSVYRPHLRISVMGAAERTHPLLAPFARPVGPRAMAYLCQNLACQTPTDDPVTLKHLFELLGGESER